MTEAKFFGSGLRHASDEVGTEIFVSFLYDLLQSFATDARAEEFVMYGRVMNGDEAVCLEHVKELG